MTLEQLRELEKQPLITIAPGDTLSGLIFPLRMIAMRSRTAISRDEPTVRPVIIPEGESGMDLTVLQGDRIIREKLTCRIAVSHMQK